MIKGQWHAKRQEGPSRETRRKSMDGWRWPVWLQCRDQGGPAQTPALTLRVSSPCYKPQDGLKGGDMIWFVCWLQWGDQITIIHSGKRHKPVRRLLQWSREKIMAVWPRPVMTKIRIQRVHVDRARRQSVRWAAHAWTLWIPNHNLWERCSSSHLTGENAEACSSLSKVQVGNNRNWIHGYLTSKPATKILCKNWKYSEKSGSL